MPRGAQRITREIKAELDRIQAASADGLLHVDEVVAAARHRRNPLHGYFNWDGQLAMENHLRAQAAQLISDYRVVITRPNGQRVRVRKFVSLVSDRSRGGGYRSIEEVLGSAPRTEELLADALNELRSFERRYEQLRELAEIFRAARRVQRRHEGRRPQPRRGATRRAAEARA